MIKDYKPNETVFNQWYYKSQNSTKFQSTVFIHNVVLYG